MVDILIRICNILGVNYDVKYFSSLKDNCKRIEYLLNQIYKYLGGE